MKNYQPGAHKTVPARDVLLHYFIFTTFAISLFYYYCFVLFYFILNTYCCMTFVISTCKRQSFFSFANNSYRA